MTNEKIQQQVDVDACLENLDHYARSGDARSCRDIGLALARDLQAARGELDRLTAEHTTAVRWMRDAQQAGLNAIADRDRLRDLAEWLASNTRELASLTSADAVLTEAITRARKALGKEG